MKKLFSPDQEAFLIENYKGVSNKELHRKFTEKFDMDVTVNQVKAFKQRNKLDSGLRGTEGIEPPNKGKKQAEFMTPEAIQRTKATQFKKGNRPANHKPVGHERIDNKDGYIIVKTKEPNVYEHKHRVVWEQANGPIPEGHNIIFLNGNRLDIRLENLEMVSAATHARLNQSGLRFDSAELTKSGVIVARLMSEMGKVKRKNRRMKDE